MSEEIFRKKSLERVKSPESLDDYIRVANPGVWLLLASVLVLLVGVCIWGIFGHVESTVDISVVAENGIVSGTVAGAEIKEGMTLRVNDTEYVISGVEHADGADSCTVTAKADIPDGSYNAVIVTDSVKPISFVLN